jgi:hypothetical protein
MIMGFFFSNKSGEIILSSVETLRFPMKNRLRGVSGCTLRILFQCGVKLVFG